jgi:hypothetical protein
MRAGLGDGCDCEVSLAAFDAYTKPSQDFAGYSDIPNIRHIAYYAGSMRKHCRHHVLRGRILRAVYTDITPERS